MLSCECDYDFTWDFFNETERTCRKACKCSECWRVINPGERYTYACGKGDGNFDVFRTCSHCTAATEYIKAVAACWCYYLGGRWNNDEDFEGEPTAVRRLVMMARRKWARQRGPRKGELYPIPWVPKLEAKP
jgi:hypothetical protein